MSQPTIYARIGKILLDHRKQMGMRQIDIASACGISRPSLANIEKGRQALSIDLLYRLAEVLRIEDVRTLLPPKISPDGKSQYAGEIAINEPTGGLTDAERAVVENLVSSADTE